MAEKLPNILFHVYNISMHKNIFSKTILYVTAILTFLTFFTVQSKAASITIQGDSLTVSTVPYLKKQLHKKYFVKSQSSKVGRHTNEGVNILKKQPLGKIVVFALGTNDYTMSGKQYKHYVNKVLKIVGKKRCLIIPTIYAYKPITQLNKIIKKTSKKHKNVRVVQWSKAVTKKKVHLSDKVHPANMSGYKYRAKMINQKIKTCSQKTVK